MIAARVSILSILLSSFLLGSSQVVWNIGYIKIDSLSSKDVGRPVKIDFKDRQGRRNRDLIRSRDTGQIVMWNDTIEFVEVRIISSDWGDYILQSLECGTYKPGYRLNIDENEILEVRTDAILFKLHTALYRTKKGKIKGEPERTTVTVWIERSKLDGVLFKEPRHAFQITYPGVSTRLPKTQAVTFFTRLELSEKKVKTG